MTVVSFTSTSGRVMRAGEVVRSVIRIVEEGA
jgi:hypothetical protein